MAYEAMFATSLHWLGHSGLPGWAPGSGHCRRLRGRLSWQTCSCRWRMCQPVCPRHHSDPNIRKCPQRVTQQFVQQLLLWAAVAQSMVWWLPCVEAELLPAVIVVLHCWLCLMCVVRFGCKGYLIYWMDWKCETGYWNNSCYCLCPCVTFLSTCQVIYLDWDQWTHLNAFNWEFQTNVNAMLIWLSCNNALSLKSVCSAQTKISTSTTNFSIG
jgi:hypothetical protein